MFKVICFVGQKNGGGNEREGSTNVVSRSCDLKSLGIFSKFILNFYMGNLESI